MFLRLLLMRSTMSVVDTLFEGGSAAVRFTGSGMLVRTRVIYYTRTASYWCAGDCTSQPDGADCEC